MLMRGVSAAQAQDKDGVKRSLPVKLSCKHSGMVSDGNACDGAISFEKAVSVAYVSVTENLCSVASRKARHGHRVD